MIQTQQTNALVLEDGSQATKSIKMSIDWESEEFLMQTLSKNFYADSIGSLCREISSNSIDSCRRANVTDIPIIVSFKKNEMDNYEFSVEDRGVGLDYDDVVDIVSKYGRSTARGDEGLLGLMGYGFKSPMAYTSSFTFIIRKDGIERKCMMYEGEDGMRIDLLDEDSTTEPNGVKVIVPVKYEDVKDFYNKIQEQLCYFESVYFDVDCRYGTIDNNFKITRYDNFQVSELNHDDSLHICLDNVYYPIDYSKLGIDRISVPVGLRFSLSDGIYPTPNREQIRYTSEAKSIIINKIKTVATKLVEMYNESVKDIDDIDKIVKFYSNDSKLLDIGHKHNIDIDDVIKYSSVSCKEPSLKGISKMDLRFLCKKRMDKLMENYTISFNTRRGRIRESRGMETLIFYQLTHNTIYKYSDRLGKLKRQYINSIICKDCLIVKKTRKRELFPTGGYSYNDNSYYTFLDLHTHPREDWRILIKELQFIESIYEKRFIDLDTLEVPKAYIDAHKVTRSYKKNGHQKLEGEISCKRAEPLERYVDGRNCKFTPFSIDLGKLPSTKGFYIYTGHENNDKLNVLYKIAKEQKITFITFSDRELKRLKDADIHNLISYEKFMEGNNAKFKRLVTAYLTNKLVRENSHLFSNRSSLSNVSTDLVGKLDLLYDYYNTNYSSGSETLYDEMVNIAKEYSLFDYSVYDVYREIKETLDKFPFLNALCKVMQYDNSARNPIIVDLLKYHKYKVNLEHYTNQQTETNI